MLSRDGPCSAGRRAITGLAESVIESMSSDHKSAANHRDRHFVCVRRQSVSEPGRSCDAGKTTHHQYQTVARRCLRKPTIRAIVPKSATSTARLRWTRSSAGKKCATIAEEEINTGVRRQWTTHRAEVQTPILSAHSRELPAETRASEVIGSGY
jgi:hypothetical protein